MPLPIYMAMTDQEFRRSTDLPTYCGWMACHFSSYSSGLTGLPKKLPPGSMLIVNDSIPPQGHDPDCIAQQLCDTAREQAVMGVLLDFQRPGNRETAAIAEAVRKALPCPVAVSHPYGENWDGPIFLPPVPPNRPLKDHLLPWAGRELWLEIAKEGLCLHLTENGCALQAVTEAPKPYEFEDEALSCHYSISLTDTSAFFYLSRTEKDIRKFLRQAEELGVTVAVGLYQELGLFYLSDDQHRLF